MLSENVHGLDQQVEALRAFVRPGDTLVLSGAGISTESGIPDYRRPDGTRRSVPMTFSEFRGSDAARRRYWLRSTLGWPRFAAAEPNVGHRAVTAWQHNGLLRGVITQNVDGLHTAAGTRDVVELHGSLAWVRCLACDQRFSRASFQEELTRLNPGLPRASELLADGDAVVDRSWEARFRLAACPWCGSTRVKPDVVMFGEQVDRRLVEHCMTLVEQSRALLVLGSSLRVMSGYRIVLSARSEGKPVAMVGQGQMRGSDRADLVIPHALGPLLSRAAGLDPA